LAFPDDNVINPLFWYMRCTVYVPLLLNLFQIVIIHVAYYSELTGNYGIDINQAKRFILDKIIFPYECLNIKR